ncbi:transposase (plasmid) [Tundrisphaera lichenicola]|uniref:transposase n=1 Tax=Tundrisphaera lichenicola TaxID=2029860 RepID=UPI003EC0ADC3
MNEYRHRSRRDFEIHPHLAWATKYRKPVPVGPIGKRPRELIRKVCGTHDVQILKSQICKDHVHLPMSISPSVTLSRPVRSCGEGGVGDAAGVRRAAGGVLGSRIHLLRQRNVSNEAVAGYIANQGESGPGNFRVEHGGLPARLWRIRLGPSIARSGT